MNASIEPTRTIIISGFSNSEELEKYKNSVYKPELMLDTYSISTPANILFVLFFDLRESIKFVNNFKKQKNNLNISYTISKYELPKKNAECGEENNQSTVVFEFLGLEIRIDDEFIVNFLRQYGDVKELKRASPFIKVVEFFNIKDARKAYKALYDFPFGTGEIHCKWDWDLNSSMKNIYIKNTDDFIKKSLQRPIESPENVKRIKTESSAEDEPKNIFFELFDKFICENLSEIETLFE